MAIYYVDLSTSHPGLYHAGTKSDPFSFEDFDAASKTGNTFYIKGQRTLNSDFYNTSETSEMKAWDVSEHGPWRIDGGSTYQCVIYAYAEDGIVYSPRIFAYGGGSRMAYYGLDSTGNHIVNGNYSDSLFIHTGNGLTISSGDSFQADNCIFYQNSGTSLYQIILQSAASGTFVDCITTSTNESNFIQSFGTYSITGMTYSWSAPTIPLSTSTTLTDYALVGTPDASSSGVGASGSWADTPSTFYVDLSEGTTGNPGHYGDAPMGFNELKPFLEASTQDGDVYKLKGSREITGSSYSLAPAGTNVTISMLPWDQKKYGPWRISVTGSYSISLGDSGKNINIEGAVLYSGDDINLRGDGTYIRSSFLNAADIIRIVSYTDSVITDIHGCTFISGTYLFVDTGIHDYQINIRDSILDIPYVRGSSLADTTLHVLVEAVVDNGDGTYTAWFGYLNNTGSTQNIAVGGSNFFSPSPQDRGQVTAFLAGRYKDMFSITWDGSTDLVWTVSGHTATASIDFAIPSYTPNPGYVGSGGGPETDAILSLVNTLGTASDVNVFNANSGSSFAIGGIAESTTEWGWVAPSWPEYDERRYLFYYNEILKNASIVGSGTYTNYSTGLWGSPRTHIGAVAFERTLYFDIDTDNDNSISDGTDVELPANYYELLTQVAIDQGIRCKIRGSRNSENRHKDVFAYKRTDLWQYNYVSSAIQYYVYNEYSLDTDNRVLEYSSPNANTYMRGGLGGDFDIIFDTALNGTTGSLGFIISDPNISVGSIYPYVGITIDGTNATATYVDSTPTTNTTTSALSSDRVLLRLRRVLSGSDYAYYFEYNENLRASYESLGWVQVWSTTLSTSALSASDLSLYIDRGSSGSSFHSVEIRADEGLEVPIPFNSIGTTQSVNILEAWDLDNYGPWRLYAFQISSVYTSLNDAIIEISSTNLSYPSYLFGSAVTSVEHSNINIKSSDSGVRIYSEGNIDFKGSTFISSGTVTLDDTKPNYVTDSQTYNRSFFDDFNSETWDSFWSTSVKNVYKLDSANSRIEAKSSSSSTAFFLTLSTSIDWEYSCQMFFLLDKSTGMFIRDNFSAEYSLKWYTDRLHVSSGGTTILLVDNGETTIQSKIAFNSSTNVMSFYFRASSYTPWVLIDQKNISGTVSTLSLGFDVGYDGVTGRGNGFDWVYLQESGTTLDNQGYPFELNFTDSTTDINSINEGNLSDTKANSNYTSFISSSTPVKGTHTNVKTSWTAPTQPAWDDGYIDSTTTPNPDSWSYITLKGNIDLGFGTNSYADYPSGLFGYERYGVGAYYFPTYNLSFVSTPNPGYTNESIAFTPENDEDATGWAWDFESDGSVDATTRLASHAYGFDSIFDQIFLVTLNTSGTSPQTATGIVGVRNRLDFELDVRPIYALGFPASEVVSVGVTGANRPLNPSTFQWTIALDSLPYTAINGVTGLSLNLTEGGSYSAQLRADDYGVTGFPGTVQQATSNALFNVLSVAINVAPNFVNVGETVSYEVTGDDVGSHTFRWRFGDSTYADGPSVTHSYLTGGAFEIELIVDRGTPVEQTITYDVTKANYDELKVWVSDLNVAFTIDPDEGYPSLTAAFEDTSSSTLGLTGWEWFFTGPPGDPFVSGETGPIFVYDTEGIYFPYLRVTDIAGYQSTATGMVTVFSSETDILVYKDGVLQPEPISENLPVNLQFRPVVSDEESIANWKWELLYNDMVHGDIILADQSTGIKANFDYTFTVPAEYKIRLTVTDIYSNVFTRTETITITESIAISAIPSSGYYPLTVAFSILNIANTDPWRITNEWDFTDDGVYDVDALSTSYIYSSANIYTCRLRLIWEIFDKYTPSKSTEIQLEKTATINVSYPPFTLGLVVNPTRGRAPLSAVLNGVANNPVTAWNWTIDGSPLVQTDQTVSYTFTDPGTYVVELTATDDFGQGPLTVQQVVQVSSELSTIDEAVASTDPTSVLEIEGSAEVTSLGYGAGFRIPPGTKTVQPSGFTTDKGITIIFD